MLAFGHAASGWLFALMLINWLALLAGMPYVAVLVITLAVALAMAGAAILPDWDYKNSTIATAFGPFSLCVHIAILEIHHAVCALTKDGTDRKPPGLHRGVTHWWPAPLVTGGGIALGCQWNRWFLFGVLLVLYTGAIRALTVSDYTPKPTHTVRHRWAMELAHKILWYVPWMRALKRGRRHIDRTKTIHITYWQRIGIPVGKIGTICVAAIFALIAIRYPWVVAHGAWVGVIVILGMFLHNLGDAPTELGIPGWKLRRFWRLPRWLAFKAGGPFEILCLWIPMGGLDIVLIPGILPHVWVMAIQHVIAWGLGIAIAGAVGIELITRYARKMEWIR